MKKITLSLFTPILLLCCGLMPAHAAATTDAPDAFVRVVTGNALQAVQREPLDSRANPQRVQELVEQHVIPYIDLTKTTRLAAARYWRSANADQRTRLIDAFKGTLLRTYSGALTKVDDETSMTILPWRGASDATDAHVKSTISQPNSPPINVDYRLEKQADGWKIYDLNVEGIWLIQNYRNQFAQLIAQRGIDGLIDALNQGNQSE